METSNIETVLIIGFVIVTIIAIIATMVAFYWRSRFYIQKRESDRKIAEMQAWLVQSGFQESRF